MGVALLLCGTFVSCKPTEKNYQAAYDAARSKREAAAEDPDMALMLGGHQLDRSEGGTAVSAVDGTKLPLKSTSLKFDEPPVGTGDWYLAVARYSMPTNARAQAGDLRAKGDTVSVASDLDSEWYVVAARTSTRTEAGDAAARFISSHPGFRFIGLDGVPLLLTSGTR